MITATITDDELALRRRILDDPDDDLPRKVYADYLMETAKTVECLVCKNWSDDTYNRNTAAGIHVGCSGTVSDGRAEYGEFIRVQYELVNCFDCNHSRLVFDHPTCRVCAWKKREDELLDVHADDWFADLPSPWQIRLDRDGPQVSPTPTCVIRRGFIEDVHLSLAALLGEPCENCYGRGTNPLGRWNGGGRGSCPICAGSGRVGGCVTNLFSKHPITSVRLTDAEPYDEGEDDEVYRTEGDGFRWTGSHGYWEENAGGGTPTCAIGGLPIELVQLMPPHPDHRKMDAYLTKIDGAGDLICTYPTTALADAALSVAAVSLGRRLVGLPPFTPRVPA